MLARLFARPANVLVMDEPTNDLDIETLELLEELIADFPGTVLLVSHDRAFLDNIVTSTLAFEGEGKVVEYVGGWEDYLRQTTAAPAATSARAEPSPARRASGGGAPRAWREVDSQAYKQPTARSRAEPRARNASSPSKNSASSSRCRRRSRRSRQSSGA